MARVAAEKNAVVYDHPAAPEGTLPVRRRVGYMLGAHHLDADGADVHGKGFAGIGWNLDGPDHLEIIIKSEDPVGGSLVVTETAPQRCIPEKMLECLVDDHNRSAFCEVPAHDRNLLDTANMIGMGMGYDNIPDIGYFQANVMHCLGTPMAAIDEEMVFPLDDQETCMIQLLGEGAADAEKKKIKTAFIGQ